MRLTQITWYRIFLKGTGALSLDIRTGPIHQAIYILLILFTAVLPGYAEELKSTGTIDVFFSPNGGATAGIVKELNAAKDEIIIQAYVLTSKPIAKAIVDAKKRGVKVEALLDKSQRRGKYSSADFIAHAGIPVYIDDEHAIAHNKIILIDRLTVITGSFNFSRAAEEKNAENLLVIKGNAALVERYLRNLEAHKGHSKPYIGR